MYSSNFFFSVVCWNTSTLACKQHYSRRIKIPTPNGKCAHVIITFLWKETGKWILSQQSTWQRKTKQSIEHGAGIICLALGSSEKLNFVVHSNLCSCFTDYSFRRLASQMVREFGSLVLFSWYSPYIYGRLIISSVIVVVAISSSSSL